MTMKTVNKIVCFSASASGKTSMTD